MIPNILIIIDSLGSGGAQKQAVTLAIGLKREGYKVSFFNYDRADFFKDKLVQNDIPIFFKEKRGKIGLNIIFHLLTKIKEEKITNLVSFLETPNFYSALAKFLNRKLQLIISYRSTTNLIDQSFFSANLKNWCNNQADYIVSNSFHEQENWIGKYPKLSDKWKVIYNGVDKSQFFPDSNTIREEHFLVVGSVGPWKNGLAIIKALAILRNRGIIIKLKWFGKKSPIVQDYIDQMEELIVEKKLESQWEWKKPTTNISQEYRNCKALILASKTEGLPNVVCEALLCGTPCIVSDVLDHPRIINAGENGFLFEPNDPNSLADVLEKMIYIDKPEYSKMSDSAFSISSNLFDVNSFINKFKSLL